ncbi:MAG TPA: hypothetical protein VI756_01160 [Blastocatellia bacterium]
MPTKTFIAVALGTPILEVVSVQVKNFTGDTVSIGYQTLPGNQPQTYQNFVAIWQSSVIPWTAPPLKPPTPLKSNSQSGSLVLDGLTITRSTYVIGYGVGQDISNICASAVLNAGGLMSPPSSVQIGINFVGTDAVSVNYQTLSGYRPKTYKNWVGLWKGYASPYTGGPPMGRADIPTDSSEGSVGINDVPMAINSNYTVIYFVGAEQTQAAAILSFNTADFEKA